MFTWIMENMATIIISAILVIMVAAVIISMVRNKRKGKSSCGCGCANCSAGSGCTRACLKIHSWHLHAPLCVMFAPNSGYIDRYAPFIWHKSPTNCDTYLPESNFQTRSRYILQRTVH